MAEKKFQENPIPETAEEPQSGKEREMLEHNVKKLVMPAPVVPQVNSPPAPTPAVLPPPVLPQTRLSSPSFTKASPNDLYRRLLPAALFLLTFVTVMTMLLIYMDTAALGAQQFRLNMTRDYELRRIAQDDPFLVAYVRQLHLGAALHQRHHTGDEPAAPTDDERVRSLSEITNNKENGTFMEVLVGGARDAGTSWLQTQRGWRGLVARAAPRDYLALRPSHAAPALHACVSPSRHPKEVTYYESSREWGQDGVSVGAIHADSGFSSRVMCFPLLTLMLVANATHCDYMLLASPTVHSSLQTLPFDRIHIQVLEVRMPVDAARNKTTHFLLEHSYKVRSASDDSVVYVLSPGDDV